MSGRWAAAGAARSLHGLPVSQPELLKAKVFWEVWEAFETLLEGPLGGLGVWQALKLLGVVGTPGLPAFPAIEGLLEPGSGYMRGKKQRRRQERVLLGGLPGVGGLPGPPAQTSPAFRWVQPIRIRLHPETGGLEPNPKPNLLLVATGSRLDSLQAKSLEPGPTKHCTRLVYTGRRNKEEDRSASSSSGGNEGPSSQPQIQTLCSSGRDRCN